MKQLCFCPKWPHAVSMVTGLFLWKQLLHGPLAAWVQYHFSAWCPAWIVRNEWWGVWINYKVQSAKENSSEAIALGKAFACWKFPDLISNVSRTALEIASPFWHTGSTLAQSSVLMCRSLCSLFTELSWPRRGQMMTSAPGPSPPPQGSTTESCFLPKLPSFLPSLFSCTSVSHDLPHGLS